MTLKSNISLDWAVFHYSYLFSRVFFGRYWWNIYFFNFFSSFGTILDLSRLPLKLAPPNVLQALASYPVLLAVIATFSFGDIFF